MSTGAASGALAPAIVAPASSPANPGFAGAPVGPRLRLRVPGSSAGAVSQVSKPRRASASTVGPEAIRSDLRSKMNATERTS